MVFICLSLKSSFVHVLSALFVSEVQDRFFVDCSDALNMCISAVFATAEFINARLLPVDFLL